MDWLEKIQEHDAFYHHCDTEYLSDGVGIRRPLCPLCALCSECCSGHHDSEVDDPVSEG